MLFSYLYLACSFTSGNELRFSRDRELRRDIGLMADSDIERFMLPAGLLPKELKSLAAISFSKKQ